MHVAGGVAGALMDVFFAISKTAGLLLAPSSLVLILILLGAALWQFAPRLHHWGRRLVVTGALTFAALGLLPFGDGMLVLLERRFAPIEDCAAAELMEPAGIIVLGGGLGSHRMGERIVDEMRDGADRVRQAAMLARRFPGAPVVVSGGQAYDNGSGRNEADAMTDLLVELGVARERIVQEAGSRTTAENAALVALSNDARPWLLVTSAFHMPRAMGTFRKAGHKVIAAPTDWRVTEGDPVFLVNAAENLMKVDLAMKEYLGLLGYWVTGQSASLFPGPQGECDALGRA